MNLKYKIMKQWNKMKDSVIGSFIGSLLVTMVLLGTGVQVASTAVSQGIIANPSVVACGASAQTLPTSSVCIGAFCGSGEAMLIIGGISLLAILIAIYTHSLKSE